jgi:transcription antitermination protein NusB
MTNRPERSATRRRRLREAVVRILYAMDVSGADAQRALADYRENLADGPVQEDLEPWVQAVAVRLPEIDEMITSASTHWRLDRMAALDRCVLRLGAWELMDREDIPARVTINEAVDIARKFGGEESPAFVNGVLDRVARLLAARRKEVRS